MVVINGEQWFTPKEVAERLNPIGDAVSIRREVKRLYALAAAGKIRKRQGLSAKPLYLDFRSAESAYDQELPVQEVS